jgi:hypothetical protein
VVQEYRGKIVAVRGRKQGWRVDYSREQAHSVQSGCQSASGTRAATSTPGGVQLEPQHCHFDSPAGNPDNGADLCAKVLRSRCSFKRVRDPVFCENLRLFL